jgi:glutamine amidotransferase
LPSRRSPPLIAVADCAGGNLHSLCKALSRVAPDLPLARTSDAAVINRADIVVFPGDGAFAACMREIAKRKIAAALIRAAAEKPFLGVCIGMQLLFSESEENGGDGAVKGLGVLPGKVIKLRAKKGIKIPHIGWNNLHQTKAHPCFAGIADGARFYFIHGFAAAAPPRVIAGTAKHGKTFAAAVARGDLFATQFHPEKSGDDGLRLLANFINAARRRIAR